MASNSVRRNHVNEDLEINIGEAKNLSTTQWMVRWKQARAASTSELPAGISDSIEDKAKVLSSSFEKFFNSNKEVVSTLKDSHELVPRAEPSDFRTLIAEPLHACPVPAQKDEKPSGDWRSLMTHIESSKNHFPLYKINRKIDDILSSKKRSGCRSMRDTNQLVMSLKTTRALQNDHHITFLRDISDVRGFDFIFPSNMQQNDFSSETNSAFRTSQMEKDRPLVSKIHGSLLHRIPGNLLNEQAGDGLEAKYCVPPLESSGKTNTLNINYRSSSPKSALGVESLFSQKDLLFLQKWTPASSKQNVVKNTILGITLLDSEENTFAEKNGSVDNTSKTEGTYEKNASMNTTEEFYHDMIGKPNLVEPRNHWPSKRPRVCKFLNLSPLAKRLKVEDSSSNGLLDTFSGAINNRSSNSGFSELHQLKNLKKSVGLLQIEECSSKEELKRALRIWIRRWCRNPLQVSNSESVIQKKKDVLHKKYKGKELPSFARMVLMDEVLRSYQPYEIQKKGKSWVWNVKEMIQI